MIGCVAAAALHIGENLVAMDDTLALAHWAVNDIMWCLQYTCMDQ